MRAFLKELVNHPIKNINGNAIPWEMVDRNKGVRNFDESHEAAVIALLDKEADLKRSGVRRISAEAYAALKKNTNLTRSTPPYEIVPPIRVQEETALLPKFRSPPHVAAVASVSPPPAPKPAPVQVPAAPTTEALSDETPARKISKRAKLADLVAKEKTLADSP